MASTRANRIAALEAQLATLRQRLRILEQQIAAYGSIAAPVHKILERDEAQAELERGKAELEQLRNYPLAVDNPYLGLLTFQEADAERFFGRSALVDDLIARVKKSRVLAVLGASGSGKSSVVRAGLIPALKAGALEGSAQWRYALLRPGSHPLDALASELAKLAGDPLQAIKYAEALATNERALPLLSSALLKGDIGQRLVLIIDQAEEVWTLSPTSADNQAAGIGKQQQQFIKLVLAAILASSSPLLVVLTIRADFLDRAAEHPELAKIIADNDVIVGPMSEDELRYAIEQPADRAGGGFEPGLIETLVEQTYARAGALPLLEYTLQELWKRQENGQLTWAAYHSLGGIEGALAARADAILAEHYSLEQQDDVRRLLLRLVRLGDGTEATRRRVALTTLIPVGGSLDAMQNLLKPLIDERLLVVNGANDQVDESLSKASALALQPSSFVELSHEALIGAWPAFQTWINDARADLRFQLQLEDAAREWQENQQNPDLLWSGVRLAQADMWLARTQSVLNERDTAFLATSNAAEQSRFRAAVAAQQEREDLLEARANAESASAQRLRIFLGLSGLFVLVLIALTTYAFTQRQTAQQQTIISLVRLLISEADQLSTDRPDLALLLGVEANNLIKNNHIAEMWQANGILLRNIVANQQFLGLFEGHSDFVTNISFSPDGKAIASSSADGTIRLWNTSTNRALGSPLTSEINSVISKTVREAIFSPDGKTLISSGDDNVVRTWDVASHTPASEPISISFDIGNSSVLSPDKSRQATWDGAEIQLWSIALPSNEQLQQQGLSILNIRERLFAWNNDTRTIQNVDDIQSEMQGQPIQIGDPNAPDNRNFIKTAAFSPDNKLLATGQSDGTIHLWNVATHEPFGSPLTGSKETITTIVFSPDSKIVAAAGDDQIIRLWDVAAGTQIGSDLVGHTSMIFCLAFSPDGTVLASGGADNTIRLWQITQQLSIETSLTTQDTKPFGSLAFSSDGKILASGNVSNTISLWDTQKHTLLDTPLIIPSGAVEYVAFSPNNNLVSSGSDGFIRLWDISSHQSVTLTEHLDNITAVALSSDGSMLAVATGASSNAIELWDMVKRQRLPFSLGNSSSQAISLAFSPDTKLLAAGYFDGTIKLWNLQQGQIQGYPLTGHTSRVLSVAFSPDGKTLASASFDRTVRLWDIASGTVKGSPLIGQPGSVFTVAFSPDGKRVASGLNSSITLWDVASHQEIGILPFGGNGLVFSPIGNTIAADDYDGAIHIWDIDTSSLVSQACILAKRNLSLTEWSEFISADQPYERICPEYPLPEN